MRKNYFLVFFTVPFLSFLGISFLSVVFLFSFGVFSFSFGVFSFSFGVFSFLFGVFSFLFGVFSFFFSSCFFLCLFFVLHFSIKNFKLKPCGIGLSWRNGLKCLSQNFRGDAYPLLMVKPCLPTLS